MAVSKLKSELCRMGAPKKRRWHIRESLSSIRRLYVYTLMLRESREVDESISCPKRHVSNKIQTG